LIVLAGAKVSRPYVILIGLMPTSYNASALFFRAFLPRLPPAAVWRGIAVWKFRRTAGRTCATPRECRPLRRAATANCRATVPLCNFPLLSSLFYRILCPALMKVFPGINVTSNVHGRTICRAPRIIREARIKTEGETEERGEGGGRERGPPRSVIFNSSLTLASPSSRARRGVIGGRTGRGDGLKFSRPAA